METSVKERLIRYLDYSKLSKSEFGRRIGVSSAFVSSMRKSIQPDKIEAIIREFPDLNISWLMTGEGDMIIKDSQPGSTADFLGNAKKPINEELKQVELSFVDPTATFVDYDGDSPERYSTISVVPISGEKLDSTYKVFRVSGDSMLPTIKSRALILVKEIPPEKWGYVDGVAVIAFGDMVVIKRVAKNAIATQNYIELSSDNPKFGSMQIPLSEIHAIYKAKRKISEDID